MRYKHEVEPEVPLVIGSPLVNPLHLGPEEVHVWHVSLRTWSPHIERFVRTLSDEERRRAERFRFERDRSRFVLARGILRTLLAEYSQCPPEALVFRYGAHGKPYVETYPFHFNLSHSGDIAVYAVSQWCRVGTDVELIRPVSDLESIARRMFTQREMAALQATPPESRTALFFRVWTRKESVLKGVGSGLGAAVQAIDVLDDLVHLRSEQGARGTLSREVGSWRVHDLPVIAPYRGALATDAEVAGLVYREWRWKHGE
jgi:4'-phosphopantetheinyl transferase